MKCIVQYSTRTVDAQGCDRQRFVYERHGSSTTHRQIAASLMRDHWQCLYVIHHNPARGCRDNSPFALYITTAPMHTWVHSPYMHACQERRAWLRSHMGQSSRGAIAEAARAMAHVIADAEVSRRTATLSTLAEIVADIPLALSVPCEDAQLFLALAADALAGGVRLDSEGA